MLFLQRRLYNYRAIKEFRHQLEKRNNVPLTGMMINFSDPMSTDALCGCSDFLWYDMEHTPFSPETLRNHIMVAKGRNTASIVRISAPNYTHESLSSIHGLHIKHVLDANADGIILPQIRNAKEIESFILDCKYPIHTETDCKNRRGFGPTIPTNYGRTNLDEYIQNANDDIFIGVTIETREAVENIEDICNVNDLDFVVIGCMDLSGSYGVPYSVNYKSDIIKKAIDEIINAAKKYGKYVMYASINHKNVDLADLMVSKGVDMILCGNDVMAAVDYQTQLTRQIKGKHTFNVK